jgi:hypothetical protein
MKLINTKTFSAKRNAIEVRQRPMPARLSSVHEITRRGATKTRIHERNQLIDQFRQQPPTRQSTAISNAVTTTPRPTKAKDGRPSKSIVWTRRRTKRNRKCKNFSSWLNLVQVMKRKIQNQKRLNSDFQKKVINI